MIDHVSIPVRDLVRSAALYERLLAHLELTRLVNRPATVGFGKRYPEFWLNRRPALATGEDTGLHVCLRAESTAAVEAFHAAALAAGGVSDGAPGARPEYSAGYYAAFVRDPEGNRIEAVTFVTSAPAGSA